MPVPGDELIPDANMVFDHARTVPAPPERVWPWIVQLGKGRAGWYLPTGVERFVPAGRRALRTLDPRFVNLAVGDAIPDYGGRNAELEVAELDAPHQLVYRDERSGTPFTWAILLTPEGEDATTVRLRFRGRLKSTGLLRAAIIRGAYLLDRSTGLAMLAGLAERVR